MHDGRMTSTDSAIGQSHVDMQTRTNDDLITGIESNCVTFVGVFEPNPRWPNGEIT